MDRIIEILKTLDRPGTDKVIEFMKESNYAKASCYKHHKYRGGLVDHSLEVYDLMMSRKGKLPESSIIVCAFFHDLGKANMNGMSLSGSHEQRSIQILDSCGFALTEMERRAIVNHHKKSSDYLTCPLRHCLSSSDMESTGKWQEANDPNYNSSLTKILKNLGLKFISKL